MEERKFWIVVALTLAVGFLLNLRFAFWPFSFSSAVNPGWHTTIFSPFGFLHKIIVLVCIITGIVIFFVHRKK